MHLSRHAALLLSAVMLLLSLAAAVYCILKRRRSRREKQRRLAEREKMQALSLFSAGIAHEFNNILNIVQGYAQALPEGGAGAAPR